LIASTQVNTTLSLDAPITRVTFLNIDAAYIYRPPTMSLSNVTPELAFGHICKTFIKKFLKL